MFAEQRSSSPRVEGGSIATLGAKLPRARHSESAVSSPGRLVWRIVRTGRVHYPILLLVRPGPNDPEAEV